MRKQTKQAVRPSPRRLEPAESQPAGNGDALTDERGETLRLAVTYVSPDLLRPSPNNPRTHSQRQLGQIAKSMTAVGNVNPILADERYHVIAGHGRLLAAKKLGMEKVPVIMLRGLSRTQKRMLLIADNKIALNSGWDREQLAAELGELVALDDFDISLTGFEPAEVDNILFDFEDDAADPADALPNDSDVPISRRGDLWILGNHRLLCGDARKEADLRLLCGVDRAAAAFLDPPFNLKIAGLVGRGNIKHSEFAMASGEMLPDEFQDFLEQTLGNAALFSRDGAVHYVCMDWRHMGELNAAGRIIYGGMLNLVAWVKSNAGQGSFYRSQHELIGVFQVGDGPHLNNVELGRHGRNRSNVWHYAGVNSFGKGRLDDLKSHPTVKPVAMVADALKDCTRRGDIVLDTFGGSGTTMLACERVGRRARLIEYEPTYVDVAIRRWQSFTGKDAVHAVTGCIFDQMGSRDMSEDA